LFYVFFVVVLSVGENNLQDFPLGDVQQLTKKNPEYQPFLHIPKLWEGQKQQIT